jgi:hypothetical protein
MGASLTMIDRHYGHLARDGLEHAIRLLDDAPGNGRGRSAAPVPRARVAGEVVVGGQVDDRGDPPAVVLADRGEASRTLSSDVISTGT